MSRTKLAFFGFLLSVAAVLTMAPDTYAQSVQVAPLLYKESFRPGEVKKGHIDVSNASAQPVAITTEVQGFRQIDNKGGLEFFPSPTMASGVLLDLKEFELKPHEKLRMYFMVDTKKLPTGDNFGAIFFKTRPAKATVSGILPSVRVGTLLYLQNGDAGERKVAIEDVQMPFLTFGDGLTASLRLKNTADKSKPSGFFPTLTTTLDPLRHNNKQEAPLVFAGNSREVDVHIPTSRLGLYKVTFASDGNAYAERWVFMATGWGLWLLIGLVIVGLFMAYLLFKWLQKRSAMKLKW